MSKSPSLKDTTRFLESLRASQRLHPDQELAPDDQVHMAALRHWQATRMRQTYADLLADRQFEPACRFFIDEVQAPLDLRQLTQDLERMYEMSVAFLPSHLLKPLALAIELNTLTRTLDQALLTTLLEMARLEDPTSALVISPEFYAESYRLCDNYDARMKQIDLVVEVGQGIDRVARIPLVEVTLRLARGPAQKAGWLELQNFLERGLRAFKRMRGKSGHFLQIFATRERKIVEQIYAGAHNPFHLT